MFIFKALVNWFRSLSAVAPEDEVREKVKRDWNEIVAFCEPIERIVEENTSAFWYGLFKTTPGDTLQARLNHHGAIRQLSTKSLVLLAYPDGAVEDRAVAAAYELLIRLRVNMKFIQSLREMSSTQLKEERKKSVKSMHDGFYFYYGWMLDYNVANGIVAQEPVDNFLTRDAAHDMASVCVPLWLEDSPWPIDWTAIANPPEQFQPSGGTFDGAGASGDWEEKASNPHLIPPSVCAAYAFDKNATEPDNEIPHPLNFGNMDKRDVPETIPVQRTRVWEKPEVMEWQKPTAEPQFIPPPAVWKEPERVVAIDPAPSKLSEDTSRHWMREVFHPTPSYAAPEHTYSAPPPPCEPPSSYTPSYSPTESSGGGDGGGSSSGD